MLRPLAVFALFAVFTVAFAACGDDDGASPTPSPTAAPTAAPSPSPTPTPVPADLVEQLAYLGPDGEIRLVNADGSGDHVFSDVACGDPAEKVQHFSMAWSPDGSALGFVCASETSSSLTLVVLDEDGGEIAHVPDVTRFRWSPDGSRIAYATLLEPFDVGILDAETGATETLNDDAVLMEWAGPDSLLLGLEPVLGDLVIEFKAHLVDVESLESTAFPEFDNARMLWVGPNGGKMIVLTDQRDPEGSGPGMAVYDFAQDLAVVIEGGYIGYPSEFIPHEQLAFSPDGARVYWANAADAATSLWTASLEDAEAEKLGEVDSLFVAVSPSGLVASVGPPQEAALGIVVIEDLAAGTRVEVGSGSLPFAWRVAAP